LLLPYATLEPIRKMLLQQFMGEKFGRDNIWEGHLASELWATKLEVRAVLNETREPLRRVLELKVGDTLMLDATADSPVTLKCGAVPLTEGRVGRMGSGLAVRVERPISKATRKAVIKLGGGK
jgi:flagellar motor switch protein FliM